MRGRGGGEPGGQEVLAKGRHGGRDVPVGLGQMVPRLGRQPGDPGLDRRVGRVRPGSAAAATVTN
jgi:hypothetical protein